ncbi:DNA ligase [Gordoniibacillus kamchatkensis]|uniref:DNA ligase (ATP) n=1 Tax=Gordoniibacillus kamchatkensis TaxID=1590651 RepID=A0ABR5AK41_9BACL|nr:RNA ligase family protein [Paenibacillus sp. VKM B-2647]KIL41213.1 DNA ligase [Paenibacillus sp. VKM B-2647]
MDPVIPFEPVVSDTIPAGSNWRYEIKWDGTRILTYHDNGGTQLYNRKRHNRTAHYPELLDFRSYCKADSAVLDGEVIALAADGKPSFHEVMRRDMIRRLERVDEMRRKVPVTYMVFDVLYVNGRWIHNRPLSERLDILQQIVMPHEHVLQASSHPDGEALFAVVRQQGMEGIVCKDLTSAYAFNGKDGRWVKVKNYGDITAVVGGFTLEGGVVNAVLLGQYDGDGKLWYIGHAGTGKLTKSDWRHLTELLKPAVIRDRPFVNEPARHRDAYWVAPRLTAKVQYSEWRWNEGRSLRQPSIQAFVDVPPEDCKLPWVE